MVSSGVYGEGTALTKIDQPAQRSVTLRCACVPSASSARQSKRQELNDARRVSECLRVVKSEMLTMEDEKKVSRRSVDPFQAKQEKRVSALLRSTKKKLSRSYREAMARQKLRDRYLNDLLDDDR